jgi:tRNA(Ile)-lysidine synthase
VIQPRETFVTDLETKFLAAWPPDRWSDVPVVVAVSGGADSVALLRLLAACRRGGSPACHGRLIVAHFNHALRGGESDTDENFVVRLTKQLDLTCHVGRASQEQLAARSGDGVENAARHLRYEFLLHAAETYGARYVATAHTADDQVETILHRIVRGTGVAGLAGISRVRALSPAVGLVRPLLGVRRQEVLDYLASLDQPFCTDTTNADCNFTRNRIRQQLLPLLAADYNSQVTEALLRLGQLAGEAQTVVDHEVDGLLQRAVQTRAAYVTVSLDRLQGVPRYLVRELLIRIWRDRGWPLQAMGFAQWDQLADMVASAGPAVRMFPGAVLVERDDSHLSLRMAAGA